MRTLSLKDITSIIIYFLFHTVLMDKDISDSIMQLVKKKNMYYIKILFVENLFFQDSYNINRRNGFLS